MINTNTNNHNVAETIVDVINSSVRPGITFMIALTICYLAVRSGISISAEAIMGVAGTVFGFWFSSKQNENTVKQLANSVGFNPTPGTVVNNVQARPCSDSNTSVDTSTDIVSHPSVPISTSPPVSDSDNPVRG